MEPDMPPAIILALGAFGAMVAVKWLARGARRIVSRQHADDAGPVEAEVHTLVQDPVTGIYRPK